jgi:hypothetical protein
MPCLSELPDLNLERDDDGIKCKCGGYAERDHKMTAEELRGRTCGRDTEIYQCCARAFVCAVCGTRWLGMAPAPDMDFS